MKTSFLLAGSAFFVVMVAASPIAMAAVAPSEATRVWTLEDQLTVPYVSTLAVAADGKSALYVVRIADLAANKTVAVLRHVDGTTGITRELLRSEWVEDLRRIPGTADWSARIEKGEGVQLYRVSASGSVTPIVIHQATAVLGDTEGAIYPGYAHAPLPTGVRSYSWSPDGRWLWYVTLDAEPFASSIRYDADVAAERALRRSQGRAVASIYLRGPDGNNRILAKRPYSDISTFFDRSFVEWAPDEVRYDVTDVDAAPGKKIVSLATRLASGQTRVVESRATRGYWRLIGLHGGRLASEGFGATRSLLELVPDGSKRHYGNFPFAVGDGRAVGGFVSADGRRALAGFRTVDNPRFGLVVLEERGVRTIGGALSLNHCDFTAALDRGVCIAQSQTKPPAVVNVDVADGTTHRIASVAPAHDAIAPLRTEARTWVNRNGTKATGYIVWPRNYTKGKRYPAIVVTHGTDADERFAYSENQWEYPAQVFAERGYVVLLMNVPFSTQSAEFKAVYDTWVNETKDRPPKEVQDRIWLNDTASFEDAVAELIDAGVVDPARVGIAGYSRGSQSVNVAMTQSQMFSAGSSGDGGILEPAFYPSLAASYNTVYGGPPTDPAALPNYLRLAPSLRAKEACGALLLQMATPYPASIDLHAAFQAAHVPTQITLYPGDDPSSDETHIFHIPSNRLKAMQENIAWFDYWLLGKRDTDSPFAGRFDGWDKMRGATPRTCDGSKSATPG